MEENFVMMSRAHWQNFRKVKDWASSFEDYIPTRRSLFESLISSIVSQQLSVKAAQTIFKRLKALTPLKAEALVKIKDKDLRAVGISQQKISYIRDLSSKALSGELLTDREAKKLTDEQIIEKLIKVKGLGRWSAQMILIFRYKKPNVWPTDDLGVQKGFSLMFPGEDIERFCLRGVSQTQLAWYCWKALDMREEKNIYKGEVNYQGIRVQVCWNKQNEILEILLRDKEVTADFPGSVIKKKSVPSGVAQQIRLALKSKRISKFKIPQGSPFQQKVWQEIAKIPYGKTKTYKELAQALGMPKAYRAVANACGANPLPLLIPCHRVVGSQGLGGFSAGVELKQSLLQSEKVYY